MPHTFFDPSPALAPCPRPPDAWYHTPGSSPFFHGTISSVGTGDNIAIVLNDESRDIGNLIARAPDLLHQRDALAEAVRAVLQHCALVHSVWGDGSNRKQAGEAQAALRAALDAIDRTDNLQ